MSFKVCGGSLRREISLASRIAFRMPFVPASYQGIASAMPQMCEIGRPFRGQGRSVLIFRTWQKGLAARRGSGGMLSGDVA